MKNYEKEIYTFFNNETNFENMLKVVSSFPMVRKQMLLDFWKLVEIKLNDALKDKFIIKVDKNILHKHSKISIYKPTWMQNEVIATAVVLERMAESYPYYGVWVNRDSRNDNQEHLYNKLKNCPMAKDFITDNHPWWSFWKGMDIDFDVNDELLKILPGEKAKSEAQNTVEIICGFLEKAEKEIDKVFQV